MALHQFSESLPVESYLFDIDDVGVLPDFASYVLRRIEIRSSGQFSLTPENTIVLCSTPSVIKMYEQLGFEILPAELADLEGERSTYQAPLPWEIVEKIAAGEDDLLETNCHPSTVKLWNRYQLGGLVRALFDDALIGDDGDLTDTRDYNAYVRQIDDNIPIKFRETAPFLRPGRIGDIGCAVGSWIREAANDPRLAESEFYGVEVSRQLFTICEQRKANGDFANPFIFFSRKNAVEGPVFEPSSMHTIHTSSLTHEIYSYVPDNSTDAHEVGLTQLRAFISNRAAELLPGGVWVNRDVVGPEDGHRQVVLHTTEPDLFLRFAQDYRRSEGEQVEFQEFPTSESEAPMARQFLVSLGDAWEFATKKDYQENWDSEMHERFCFWSETDWRNELGAAGLHVVEQAQSYTNPWIVENRLLGKLWFTDPESGDAIDYPPTTILIIAERI